MSNSNSQARFLLIAIMMIGGTAVVRAGLFWETSIDCYVCDQTGQDGADPCPVENDGKLALTSCTAPAGSYPWCGKWTYTTVYDDGQPAKREMVRGCLVVDWTDNRRAKCNRTALGAHLWEDACECSCSLCNA